MERLDVWFDDTRAAVLERPTVDDEPFLAYTEDARARWGDGTPLLSVRLPIRGEPWPARGVRHFLAGLLPEGEVRSLLFRRAKLAEDDVFGYLRAFGADCAGAISIVEAGSPSPPTDEATVEWLDDGRLEQLLKDLPRAPLGTSGPDGEVKLSLAGVQHKLVLVQREDGTLGLPLRGHPSSHILKPDPDHRSRVGLILVEAFCMKLAQRVGVPAAQVSVVRVAGKPVLLVSRYDREIDSRTGTVRRVHQEDLCQAVGRAPALKYEKQGGIGFKTAASILWQNSAQTFVDLSNLLRLATLTVLVEHGDGHAKNISLLHTAAHALRLAPAYDVACATVFLPDDTLAMQVNGAYRFGDVDIDDLVAEAGAWQVPPTVARRLVRDVVDRVMDAVGPVLQEAQDDKWFEPILDDLAHIVRRAGDRLTGQR